MSVSRRSAVGAALVRMCDERATLLVAMLRKMTAELAGLRPIQDPPSFDGQKTLSNCTDEPRSRKLGEFATRDPRSLVDDLADPHGEVTESCEATEAYFRAERNDLAEVCRALSSSPDSNTDDPEVFAALDRLDDAFRLAVDCMQEARWLVLMANGGRDAPASNRTFASGPELLATIEAETEATGSHTGTA